MMKPKEAIALLRNTAWLGNEESVAVTEEAINTLEGIVKSAEQYRWHDLRKDLNDLPTTDERIVVKVVWYEDGKPYDTEYYTDYYCRKHWVNDNMALNATVVAWKYIEPFEEAEE